MFTSRPLSTLGSLRLVIADGGPLRWRLPAAAAVTLGMAATEGLGLLLILPLLGAVGVNVDTGATAPLASSIREVFAALGVGASLGPVLCGFVLVTSVHAALYGLSLVLNPQVEQQFGVMLRTRLFSAVLGARWSFLGRTPRADLLHAVTSETDRAVTAISQLLAFATTAVITGVYVAVAFRLSPVLTLLVAACGAALLYALRRRTHESECSGERYVEVTRAQFQAAAETLAGLKTVKSLAAEQTFAERFARAAVARADAYTAVLAGFARSKVALDVGAAIVMSLLLYSAVTWLRMTGAALLMLVLIFSRIMPRVLMLQAAAQTAAANLPSLAAVAGTIAACEAHAETVESRGDHARAPRRAITFDRVSFAYEPGRRALDDVSVEIPAGSLAAIVGPSGAGKSTLADLLSGLLRPDAGQILVDGVPLTEGDGRSWRRTIGYVPQDGLLLAGTIRDNLRFAKPDASDAEMWIALERAAAADFVRDRPEGLDTRVGEGGAAFSGGERQRVVLARTLLTSPGVLILDEATSALDSASERQILDAVRALHGTVTCIVITHRLHAIRDADCVHVLESGRVVESGRWQQLAVGAGSFARLLRAARDNDAHHPAAFGGLPANDDIGEVAVVTADEHREPRLVY